MTDAAFFEEISYDCSRAKGALEDAIENLRMTKAWMDRDEAVLEAIEEMFTVKSYLDSTTAWATYRTEQAKKEER